MAPGQKGPSPHVHENLDELMYVLEGKNILFVFVKKDLLIFHPPKARTCPEQAHSANGDIRITGHDDG